MATIQFENGTKVQFDGNPTPQDVEEVANKLGLKGSANPAPRFNQQSSTDMNLVKPSGFGSGLIKNEVGVGNTLASGLIPKLPSFQQAQTSASEAQGYGPRLLKAIRAAKEQGKDTSNLERVYKDTTGQDISAQFKDINPSASKTNKQALGEVAGTGIDLLSFGSYGAGAKTGQLAVKALPTATKAVTGTAQGLTKGALVGAVKGATAGALVGAGQGFSEGLQQDKSVKDSLGNAISGAETGALVGGTIGAIGGGIAGRFRGAGAKSDKEVAQIIQPNINKKIAINTLKQSGSEAAGAQETGLFKTVSSKVTPQVQEIVKDVKPFVSAKNSPIKNIGNLNQEITRVSQKELEPSLAANKTLLNVQTISKRLQGIEPTRLIKSDDTLNRTYNQVRELMLETIADHTENATSIDSKGLWRARKAFDNAVESQFGDAVYNPEKNSAVKQAVRDIRSKINDIIGENNSGYRPQLKKLNNMYTARDNIAENNWKILTSQTNRLTRFRANHPVLSRNIGRAIGYTGAGLIGGGITREALQ